PAQLPRHRPLGMEGHLQLPGAARRAGRPGHAPVQVVLEDRRRSGPVARLRRHPLRHRLPCRRRPGREDRALRVRPPAAAALTGRPTAVTPGTAPGIPDPGCVWLVRAMAGHGLENRRTTFVWRATVIRSI